MTSHVLIVEDDVGLSQMLALQFEDQGMRATTVTSCGEAIKALGEDRYDLMLLDQQLPDGLGIDLLPRLRELAPGLPVIMMTGRHDLELAIEAIKTGATEFIHKPLRAAELERLVEQVLTTQRLAQQAAAIPAAPSSGPARGLIGRSNAMLAVSKEIALSAPSQASVLISGASGTGKEVVARLFHQHSGRPGPFVAVNCAALVDTLLESELFGHEKGAFTGALSRKPGKLELAQHGTLFLDEVGELAPHLQAKLLRVLQERMFERVGGTESIHSDVRLVAATNRDLASEVRAGRFREDLWYRLNVVSVRLPPLCERREDIPLLVHALLERIAHRLGQAGFAVTITAMEHLSGLPWPGNVRELENVLTQAAMHARGGIITPDLLDDRGGALSPSLVPIQDQDDLSVFRSLDQIEAGYIQRVLGHTDGHKGRASQILGISRPALDRKIRKYHLKLPGR